MSSSIYFVLACAIAWGGAFAAVGPKFLLGEPMQFTDDLFMLLPMLAGPSVAGITVTATRNGTGFFEEIGWMGYACPEIELRHGAFTAGIYLRLIWTMWHAAADYLGASGDFGAYLLPHFLVWMVATFTAMMVLIIWVYTNTRSLLLAQVMHATSTGFLSAFDPSLSPANSIFFMGSTRPFYCLQSLSWLHSLANAWCDSLCRPKRYEPQSNGAFHRYAESTEKLMSCM